MKIPWNWGTKLVIAITLWISFILFMVLRMIQVDVPLVEEDYYPKAIVYQDQIDKRTNAKALGESIQLIQSETEIKVVYPSGIKPEDLSGSLWIYRPAEGNQDFHLEIKVDSLGTQIFNRSMFHKGRYIFKFDFADLHTKYYQEVTIEIH
jgi:hypothetical protein